MKKTQDWIGCVIQNMFLMILIGFCCWLFKSLIPLWCLLFTVSYEVDFCSECGKRITEGDK